MTTDDVMLQLAAPFDLEYFECKVQSTNKAKTAAMATCYIDARGAQKRLNDVFGIDGWSFDWEPMPELVPGQVAVKGTLRFGDTVHADVGVADFKGDGAGAGNAWKGAVSDALKRCCVQTGMAQYLYQMPDLWFPYNQEKKRFVESWKVKKLLHELSLEVHAAGGDLSKIDMRRYRDAAEGGGGEQRSESRASSAATTTATTEKMGLEASLGRKFPDKADQRAFLEETLKRAADIPDLTQRERNLVMMALHKLPDAQEREKAA